jgi:hypothetical protein
MLFGLAMGSIQLLIVGTGALAAGLKQPGSDAEEIYNTRRAKKHVQLSH